MRFFGLLGMLLSSLVCFADNPVQELGEIGHLPISEVSGIARSETYPDTYWLHNDSGDSPRLFTINQKGEVIRPSYVDNKAIGKKDAADLWQGLPVYLAANQDWEDIAVHEDLIYIADLGNNGNARRDLGVYVLREPNPSATVNSRTLNYYPVEYPDQEQFPAKQWHFDSESLFVDAGTPYVITKHREPGKIGDWERGAKLYRLDSWHSDKVNQLAYIESHPEVSIATGADLSPNGEWLAVLCYTDIWLFKRPEQGDAWLSSESYRLPLDFRQTGQVEAITWIDDDTLLFTNEPGQLFTVHRADIPKFEME